MESTQRREVEEENLPATGCRAMWVYGVVLIGLLTQTLGFHPTPMRLRATDSQGAPWMITRSSEAIPVFEGDPIPSSDVGMHLDDTLSQFHIDADAIPEYVRQNIEERVHRYTVVHHLQIQQMLHRAAPYMPVIKRLLVQHDLPTYFAYIPLAESAFEADAAHPESGAVGLWQLMPGTARAYGLRVSDTVDERRDPFLSTRAAVRYLKELQEIFGQKSPLLILAAYNYGENNLSKAIVRARTRDIWSLLRKRQLPIQTRDYLVKMVALWIVSHHVDRYRSALLPSASGALAAYTEITFGYPVSVAFIAQQIGLSNEHLRLMNPQLLKGQIPANTPVRIPAASVEAFEHLEVRLADPLSTERCCARLLVTNSCYHAVQEGETASSIARRYAIGLNTLKELNQLEGANPILHPGKRLAVCETSPTERMTHSQLW